MDDLHRLGHHVVTDQSTGFSQLDQLDLLSLVVLQGRQPIRRIRSQNLSRLHHLERRLDFLGLDQGLRELHLCNLVLVPDAVDDLVLLGVDKFALTLFHVVNPLALVLRPVQQVNLTSVTFLPIAPELALIVLGLVNQLSKPMELPLLEFADVFHIVALQMPEPVWFTVPKLALVVAVVSKNVASLPGASTILPFTRVDIAALKLLAALAVLFASHKVARVHVTRLEAHNTKALPHTPHPLAFVLIAIFEHD